MADPAGALLASWGDPETVTFLRSSAKPLQALACVESGAADRFGLAAPHIALMCASHSGTEDHVRGVAEMLAAVGAEESDLQCGTHAPLDPATARRLENSGVQPRPLQHNCSGKHAGMLALGEHLGAARGDYLNPDGAVQRLILDVFAEMCGIDSAQVGLGVDGCSAPNFAVPLRAAATAYARIMAPWGPSGERASACARIRAAMSAHPELVGGPGRFDTRLTEACRGRIVSKGGAEGFQAFGLPAGALGPGSPACGIVFKIADGDRAGRAVSAVGLAALSQLGAMGLAELEPLADLMPPRPVENNRGLLVGEMRVCFQLARPG